MLSICNQICLVLNQYYTGVMKKAVKRTSTGVDRRPGRRPGRKGCGRCRPVKKLQAGRRSCLFKNEKSLHLNYSLGAMKTAVFKRLKSTILHFSSGGRRPPTSGVAHCLFPGRQQAALFITPYYATLFYATLCFYKKFPQI